MTRRRVQTMRTLATVFLATLIVFALAPTTILADHEQTPQATPSHGNHHNGGAAPHDHAAEQNHNHDGQFHPHEHTIWQRLHNALFGRYHIQGTCAPAH